MKVTHLEYSCPLRLPRTLVLLVRLGFQISIQAARKHHPEDLGGERKTSQQQVRGDVGAPHPRAHLHAGDAHTHGSDDLQVVQGELLQFADAAALEGEQSCFCCIS